MSLLVITSRMDLKFLDGLKAKQAFQLNKGNLINHQRDREHYCLVCLIAVSFFSLCNRQSKWRIEANVRR